MQSLNHKYTFYCVQYSEPFSTSFGQPGHPQAINIIHKIVGRKLATQSSVKGNDISYSSNWQLYIEAYLLKTNF